MAYFDDLKHHRLPGSTLETVTDMYTDDLLTILNQDLFNTVHISGGNDTVSMLGTSSDTIYDDPAANRRPFNGLNGTLIILPGSGPSGNDIIHAGGGNDTIFAGDGINTYDGGDGIDTVNFSRAVGNMTIDLTKGYASGFGSDTLTRIENVVGSSHDDFIVGTAGDNDLNGGGGNDTLLGGAGADHLYGGNQDDTLIGGTGADTMDGGNGIDTVDYSSARQSYWVLPGNHVVDGVFVNLRDGMGLNSDAGGDTYANIENVRGSAFGDLIGGTSQANAIYGKAGNDILAGLGGADDLDGGDGIDTVSYYGSDSGVTVDLGTNQVSGGDAAGDTILNFENVIGSDHADTLVGSNGDNVLDGQGGDDTLVGGGGSDTFRFGPASLSFPDSALGHDTINDYTVGVDHLVFDNSLVQNISDLQFSQNGSDTVITFFDEAFPAAITLRDVDLNDLLAHSQTDFIF